MNKHVMNIMLSGLVAASLFSSPVFSQDATDPGHPRINQVDQRLENQDNRINHGVADGQISPRAATRDENRDARVERQMGRDEAKHNGHLTKREQRHMNHELNHNSHSIYHQRHNQPKPAPATR